MRWILFILILIRHFQPIRGLQLVDNGYEGLYIVIDGEISENHELLDRIQVFSFAFLCQ